MPFVALVLVATEQHAQIPALKKTTDRFFLASAALRTHEFRRDFYTQFSRQ